MGKNYCMYSNLELSLVIVLRRENQNALYKNLSSCPMKMPETVFNQIQYLTMGRGLQVPGSEK